MLTPACACAPTQFPFYCERHRCEKNAHFLNLCRARDDYRLAWDENRGPCQEGVRCFHRRAFESCKYCAALQRHQKEPNEYEWPGGVLLAEYIDKHGLSGAAVDIGCGTGIVGLAALRRGCFVTFQDISREAIGFARHNAEAAGFQVAANFDVIHSSCANVPPLKFDNVLGSEINTETEPNKRVLRWVLECWTGHGVCLFAGAHTIAIRDFAALIPAQFHVRMSTLENEQYATDLVEITT